MSPTPRPESRDLAAQEARERAEREEARATRRRWLLALLAILGWCFVGGTVTVLGFALVLPPETARLLVDAGGLLAAAGSFATVLYVGHLASRDPR